MSLTISKRNGRFSECYKRTRTERATRLVVFRCYWRSGRRWISGGHRWKSRPQFGAQGFCGAAYSLYYKDFDGNGSMDAVLCEVVNGKDSSADVIGFWTKWSCSRNGFFATLPMLMPPSPTCSHRKNCNRSVCCMPIRLRTLFFWNKRKEGFVAQVLPNGAQLSMAQAVPHHRCRW